VAWLADRFVMSREPVEGRLLVFDMGGGTLDVAVLDVVGGERPDVRVLAALGATLAGDLLDEQITRDLVAVLAGAGVAIDALANPVLAAGLLRRQAAAAKIALSTDISYPVTLLSRVFGRVPPIRYSREQLEQAFAPQMDSAEQLVHAALRVARLTERYRQSTYDPRAKDLLDDVNLVLLTGGMSRIPYVRHRLGLMLPHAKFVESTVAPDEAVVAGLTDTAGYERINLHRPAFDFLLEWDEGRSRRTLYEAYTPLYEPWQIASGHTHLGHERRGRELDLPRSGNGRLVAVAANGQPVNLVLDGQSRSEIPVGFGHYELWFKIHCDGKVSLTDGAGREFEARVDRWPVIQGRDDTELKLKNETEPPPDPPTPWYLNKPD
jgi:hypothetical protein